MNMQVRAQRAGFFGADFKPAGAVFNVPDGTTASWFVPIATQAEAGKPQGQPAPYTPKPKRIKAQDKAGTGLSGANFTPAPAPAPAPAVPDSP